MGKTERFYITRVMSSVMVSGMIFSGAASAAEPQICDSADHCVWIMENHGPHEFDYDVIIKELEGFGQESKDFLIMMVGDKDADIAGRAIDILEGGNFAFSSEEKRLIIKEWPGSNVDKLANLLVKIGSPDVQGRMIESLLLDDKKVRRVARDVLARMRLGMKIYQLREFEHGPIAKAVVEAPTRELVQMLAAFPAEKTVPFLQRALKSDNAESVIAAYEALYEIDKEMAFATLLKTLGALTAEDAKPALALGALLRQRHKGRADGFYLQFAKELAEDPKMSLMGRVAGVEAILGSDLSGNPKAPQKLAATSPVITAFKQAVLARGDNVHPYEANFVKVMNGKPADWASVLWRHLQENQQSDGTVYRRFFSNIERFKSARFQSIILNALVQHDNTKTLKFALNSVIVQNDKIYASSVKSLTNHWADEVRYLARLTEKVLAGEVDAKKTGEFAKAYKAISDGDRALWKNCSIKGKAQIDYVRQLPYFTLQEEVSESYLKRRYITASYPTQPGWFVGFDNPENGGGLWFYDNETGLGENLSADAVTSVRAIMPMRVPAQGQYTNDFWVVSADPVDGKGGRLYRANQRGEDMDAVFHRYLPRSDFKVSKLAKDAYLLTHKQHSPLVLQSNGIIKPACQ